MAADDFNSCLIVKPIVFTVCVTMCTEKNKTKQNKQKVLDLHLSLKACADDCCEMEKENKNDFKKKH